MINNQHFVVKATVLALLIVGFWLYWNQAAYTHSFYAPECCSERDCAPLPKGFVQAVQGGWHIHSNNEIIPYDDRRIKISPDGRFHGCFPAANAKLRMLCLYVPSQGS